MKNPFNKPMLAILLLVVLNACEKIDPVTTKLETDNKSKDLLKINAGTIYFVDDLNGNDNDVGISAVTAWKTIVKVNSIIFQPGDKILFKAGGSWTGQLYPQGSGIAGNPITIGSYESGNKPKINGEGTVNATIYLNNQQYWEINDLEVTNFDASEVNGQSMDVWEANNDLIANEIQPAQFVNNAIPKIGILITAQDIGVISHIYLRNLEVHGVNGYIDQADETSKHNGGICFRIIGTAIVTWFDDILVDGCTIRDVDRTGFWLESSWNERTFKANISWKPSLNVIIRNNTFNNIGANALIIRVADYPLMERNLFDHCAIKASGNAAFNFNTDNAIWQYNESRYTKANINDRDAGGIDSDYKSKNTVIQYNYIHDNDFGMLVTGGPRQFNDNTIIRYNIFKKDGKFPHPSDGKFLIKLAGNATRTSFYNNVVDIGPSQTDTKMIQFHSWSGWPSNTSFYNNIFDNTGTNTSYDFGSSTNNVFDYNSFYKTQTTDQPEQVHNISGDMKCVDPGVEPEGFKIRAGSVGLLSGKVISNNGGKDYFGNSVSSSAVPNVGAYNGVGL